MKRENSGHATPAGKIGATRLIEFLFFYFRFVDGNRLVLEILGLETNEPQLLNILKLQSMTIQDFISKQPQERQELLSEIHETILTGDKSIKAEIAPMMGKEMIVYKAPGIFKYGLSGVKNYMSLHVMPIYGSTTLYAKYKNLLDKANFQKGCINFKNKEEMPLKIIKQLIHDCAKIDLYAIRQEYIKSKSGKA